jgi:hypothetical protein
MDEFRNFEACDIVLIMIFASMVIAYALFEINGVYRHIE